MSAGSRRLDGGQSAQCTGARSRSGSALPPAFMERLALEFLLALLFILFVLGRAIFEHAFILVASTV
jgi:hypothetical protein